MVNSFIYNTIPSEHLDACGYFEPKTPFLSLSKHNFIENISGVSLSKKTLVIYFPGSFGHWHPGHMSVVRRAYYKARRITDDFVIVISPSGSDYAVYKYGDTDFATNKSRYDRITAYASELEALNAVIDLNPMLNFEVDHNFTDFLRFFVEKNIGDFDTLEQTPIVVSGKDRNFSELEKHTSQVRFDYYDVTDDFGTSTHFKPSSRAKPDLYLRVNTHKEFDLFCEYMGEYFQNVEPIFIEDERQKVKEIESRGNHITICKDYADILPYVPLSRQYANPLSSPVHKLDFDQRKEFERYKGSTVIDSDVFSGTTRRFVESLGFEFKPLIDLSDQSNVELLDIDDFKLDQFAYPFVDISSRCSLPAFSLNDHRNFTKFKMALSSLSQGGSL